MPPPADIETLFDLIHKSELIDPEKLRDYSAKIAAEAGPKPSVKDLAIRMIRDGLLTRFQAGQLLQGKCRDFIVLKKYKLLEPIGEGGMSKVFLVEHVAMGHRVAMKILQHQSSKDDLEMIARFKREAKAIASMNHPNVVRAHDIDSNERYHYIIMDYVDGINLHELVRKRGKLSPGAAAHYAYHTAMALQHVHDVGLIHRDIKPGNILIDRDGTVRILDLGLARVEAEGGSFSQRFDADAVLGTADFLAPEQANHGEIDGRVDIYGLGTTLYFLLTGQAPFESEKTVAQKLVAHQTLRPVSLTNWSPEVPKDLVAIVEKMMEKDPAKRFSSAGELADALADWADLEIPPPSEEEMPRRSPAAQSPPSYSSRPTRGGPSSFASHRRGNNAALTDAQGSASRPGSGRNAARGLAPASSTILSQYARKFRIPEQYLWLVAGIILGLLVAAVGSRLYKGIFGEKKESNALTLALCDNEP